MRKINNIGTIVDDFRRQPIKPLHTQEAELAYLFVEQELRRIDRMKLKRELDRIPVLFQDVMEATLENHQWKDGKFLCRVRFFDGRFEDLDFDISERALDYDPYNPNQRAQSYFAPNFGVVPQMSCKIKDTRLCYEDGTPVQIYFRWSGNRSDWSSAIGSESYEDYYSFRERNLDKKIF